jgi:hypothetical protein
MLFLTSHILFRVLKKYSQQKKYISLLKETLNINPPINRLQYNRVVESSGRLNKLNEQNKLLQEKLERYEQHIRIFMNKEYFNAFQILDKLVRTGKDKDISLDDWKSIESLIEVLDIDYYEHLEQIPNLSSRDKHICYLSKLDFKTKRISEIFCIAPNTVSKIKGSINKL